MRENVEDEFAVEIISKGSYVDNGVGNGKSYLIEVYVIKLNHIALNEWLLSLMHNTRECYETNAEWEEHKAKYRTRHEAVSKKIVDATGVNPIEGSVKITQALAEVFSVVHIKEIGQRRLKE